MLGASIWYLDPEQDAEVKTLRLLSIHDWEVKSLEIDDKPWLTKQWENVKPDRETRAG